MARKQLISFLIFVVVWLLFWNSVDALRHFHKLPMGVHQGAQCDRASLAQNYYYNGFRFLYPEVNETRCIDGIVSCEMPLTNYLAACLYKVFGYDEFWFRLLTFIFLSAGMFALLQLFRLWLNAIAAFLLVLLINSSPVILFYGPNFLPDASSLGLMLAGWYLFFRQHIPHTYLPPLKSRYWQVLMILCLAIGIAIKTTSLIQWLTMLFVLALSYIPALRIEMVEKRKLWRTLALTLSLPLAWYLWSSQYLAKMHNFQYFMMSIPHYASWAEYRDSWLTYLANWPDQAFPGNLYYFVFAMFFVMIALKKFIHPNLWFISFVNFLGSASFMILMIAQYKYHDYYIICLYPAFVLCWIALASAIVSRERPWWLRLACFLAIFIAFRYQYDRGKVNLEHRYTRGDYWEQSFQDCDDYSAFRKLLEDAHIDRNQCVIAGMDPSPNNMLYLLHLRGHRLAQDHDEKRISHVLSSHPSYLISNDSLLTSQVGSKVRSLTLEVKYKYLHAYKINY